MYVCVTNVERGERGVIDTGGTALRDTEGIAAECADDAPVCDDCDLLVRVSLDLCEHVGDDAFVERLVPFISGYDVLGVLQVAALPPGLELLADFLTGET